MKERLIEWICENINDECAPYCKHPYCDECKNLANHLLANGVIVPPCKVGDTVWWADAEFEELLKGEAISFSLQKEGLWAYCRYKGGLTYWHLVSDYFGKTIFLTREEAEKSIKGETTMIFLMYISSSFLALAALYAESKICGVFIYIAFTCSLVADCLWTKHKEKIKALEKALAERKVNND